MVEEAFVDHFAVFPLADDNLGVDVAGAVFEGDVHPPPAEGGVAVDGGILHFRPVPFGDGSEKLDFAFAVEVFADEGVGRVLIYRIFLSSIRFGSQGDDRCHVRDRGRGGEIWVTTTTDLR